MSENYNILSSLPNPNWKVGAQYKKFNLSHINFEGGVLTDADFSEVIFDYANLKRCDMSRSNLFSVHMHNGLAQSIILESASVIKGNFCNTNLVNANFRNADFFQAEFKNCNMENANLMGGVFQEAKIIGCDLNGAILINADLRGTDLTKTNLQGAILTGALLEGAILDGAILVDTIIEDSQLQEARSTQGIVCHEIVCGKIQMGGEERIAVQLYMDADLLERLEGDALFFKTSINELSVNGLSKYLNMLKDELI